MPIDSQYAMNSMAAQQAYFAQQQAMLHNMPVYAGIESRQAVPVPQVPPAPSGYTSAPQAVQPQFGSSLSVLQGMFGMGGDPFQFHPAQIQAQARQRMSRGVTDIGMGVMGSIPEIAELATYLVGIGGGVPGMALSIGAGYGVKTALSPLRWAHEEYRMGRQLETELGGDPRFRGVGFGQRDYSSMAREIGMLSRERPGMEPAMGMERVSGLLTMGMEQGQFDFASNPEEFTRMFKKYVRATRTMARTLKVSLEEGAALMGELRQMGFFDLNAQVEALTSMAGAANLAGVGVGQMAQIAGAGAQMLGGPWGALPAARMAGRLGHVGTQGPQQAAMIARMGGVTNATMGLMQGIMGASESPLGTLQLAQGMMGRSAGEGFNLAALSGGMAQDPMNLIRLMNPYTRQQMIGEMGMAEMGGNMINNISSQMIRSGISTEMANDPVFLSTILGMSPDQISAIQAANTPEAIEAQTRAEQMARLAPEGGRRGAISRSLIFGPLDLDVRYSLAGTGERLRAAYSGAAAGGVGERVMASIGRTMRGTTSRFERLGQRISGEYYAPDITGWGSELNLSTERLSRIQQRAWSATTSEEGGEELVEQRRVLEEKLFGGRKGGFWEGLGESMLTGGLSNTLGFIFEGARIQQMTELSENPAFQRALLNLSETGDTTGMATLIREETDLSDSEIQGVITRLTENRGAVSQYIEGTMASERQVGAQLMRTAARDLSGIAPGTGFAEAVSGFRGGIEGWKSMAQAVRGLSEEQRRRVGAIGPLGSQLLAAGRTGKVDETYEGLLRQLNPSGETEGLVAGQQTTVSAQTVRIDNPVQLTITSNQPPILATDASANHQLGGVHLTSANNNQPGMR